MEKIELIETPQARSAWNEYVASGVVEDIGSFHFCYVLHALHTSGLADFFIHTARFGCSDLPQKYNPHLAKHLLRYLVIRGVLVEDGDTLLTLSEYGRRCLGPTTLAQIGFYVEAYASVTSMISPLLTGKSLYGKDIVRDGRSLGAHCATLFTLYHIEIVLTIVKEKNLQSILDLGCGGGAMLIDACKQCPDLKGYGLDNSAGAIAFANDLCRREGLENRISFTEGDAFDPGTWPEYQGLDAITAVGALHEHFRDGEDAVVAMLNIFACLIKAGKVKYFILGEPELYYDQEENDPDLYLIHIFTAQGFPRRKELWMPVIQKSELQCEEVYTRTGIGPRFCFYLLTLRNNSL